MSDSLNCDRPYEASKILEFAKGCQDRTPKTFTAH